MLMFRESETFLTGSLVISATLYFLLFYYLKSSTVNQIEDFGLLAFFNYDLA